MRKSARGKSGLRLRTRAFALALALVATAGLPGRSSAAIPSCGVTGQFHNGHKYPVPPEGNVHGALGTLEYSNETLCVGSTTKSFSATWVAIVATSPNDPNGWDIYQIGIMKCRTCGGSWSPNVTYIVYAYGREGTVCSPAVPPVAQKSVSAGIANTVYKVARGVDLDGDPVYYVQSGATRRDEEPVGNLDNCWIGGPKRPFFANETGNESDQSGGRTGAPQNWFGTDYQTPAGAWVNLSGTVGNNCSVISRPAWMRCKIGPAADGIEIWDIRG